MADISIREDSKILINGHLLEGASVWTLDGAKSVKGEPTRVLFEPLAFGIIQAIAVNDLLEHFDEFDIYLPTTHWLPTTRRSTEPRDWWFHSVRIRPDVVTTGRHLVGFGVSFDPERWNRPYSIADLRNCFRVRLSEFGNDFGFFELEWALGNFGVTIPLPNDVGTKRTSVGNLIAEMQPQLERLSVQLRSTLECPTVGELATQFDFPEEMRAACEQYLSYFGQFLRDLGIEVETQMTERASTVLFTVKPKNREEALDVIREALSCYLQMPGAPGISTAHTASDDIAIIQLNSNIMHLRSQVMLANAVAQAKDAIISAKQTEIQLLKENLDLRAFAPALPKPSDSDSEQIIEGVLAVKRVEYKGFELNTPEILRRLKRLR